MTRMRFLGEYHLTTTRRRALTCFLGHEIGRAAGHQWPHGQVGMPVTETVLCKNGRPRSTQTTCVIFLRSKEAVA